MINERIRPVTVDRVIIAFRVRFDFVRCRRQRTVADHPTDAAETDETDWFVVDTQLPAGRRPAGVRLESKMARPAKPDDRSNVVSTDVV